MPTPKKIYLHLEHPQVDMEARIVKQLKNYNLQATSFLENSLGQLQHFTSVNHHPAPKIERRNLVSKFFKPTRQPHLAQASLPSRASFIANATTDGFKIQELDFEKLISKLNDKQQRYHENLITTVQHHGAQIDKLLHFITSTEFMSQKSTQEFARKLKI